MSKLLFFLSLYISVVSWSIVNFFCRWQHMSAPSCLLWQYGDDRSSAEHRSRWTKEGNQLDVATVVFHVNLKLFLFAFHDCIKDKDGRTPLHWCTNNKDPKSIEIILEKVT